MGGQCYGSQQVTGRLYCENDSCSNSITHYCSDCDQVLCASCSVGFHQKCKSAKIPDLKEVAYSLDITKSVLSSIRQDSKHFKTSSITKRFDNELRMFTEMLSMINEKFATSVENNNSHEFCSIMKELVQLQMDLDESGLLAQSSMSAEFKLAQIKEQQKSASETTLIGHQRVSDEEDIERQINKGGDETTEHKTENIQEKTILNEDNCKILKLTYNPIHHSEDSKQVDKRRPNNQKQVISDITLKDIKQREFNILEQERKIQEVVFSRIYHRRTGKEISSTSSFNLKISLNYAKKKSLMRDCMTSRLRLPDLNGILVDNITYSNSDSKSDLANFLSNCTPAKLKLFLFDWDSGRRTRIYSRFYFNAFSEAARRATIEVNFRGIRFSAKDLQTVVRAACNAEGIVFQWCNIHCSSGVDFGANLRYNTKYLRFCACKFISYKKRMKGWKEDQSRISLIVDAIGSSGLKASLEEFNIDKTQSLSYYKVQEQLKAKGMSHISVIDKNRSPLIY